MTAAPGWNVPGNDTAKADGACANVTGTTAAAQKRLNGAGWRRLGGQSMKYMYIKSSHSIAFHG